MCYPGPTFFVFTHQRATNVILESKHVMWKKQQKNPTYSSDFRSMFRSMKIVECVKKYITSQSLVDEWLNLKWMAQENGQNALLLVHRNLF